MDTVKLSPPTLESGGPDAAISPKVESHNHYWYLTSTNTSVEHACLSLTSKTPCSSAWHGSTKYKHSSSTHHIHHHVAHTRYLTFCTYPLASSWLLATSLSFRSLRSRDVALHHLRACISGGTSAVRCELVVRVISSRIEA